MTMTTLKINSNVPLTYMLDKLNIQMHPSTISDLKALTILPSQSLRQLIC